MVTERFSTGMIQASNITLRIGKRALFEDVNIKFTEGNCYGLIGANGAGKSTFLKLLTGEIEPNKGEIVIEKNKRMSVLNQNQNAFDDKTILQTVLLGHKRLAEIEKLKKEVEALKQQKLMKKLAEKPAERIVEKEVAATNVSEETLERLVSKLQPTQTNISENVLEQLASKLQTNNTSDETIKRMLKTQEDLMRNQDRLMEKILELSANKPIETQVVEKIVEKPIEKIVEVPVEVEKIVEKEVVKEVPIEVEKIVEKEVPVEKIVEVPIEVEKVVEKIVEIPATKPAPKAKATAPRLTLDEAYEKLSAKQKKFFDTLKEYAMSKDKCKEKKSTYYILLGQSSVNPLVKLTIKKDCTVALFKMEDEYMKDIRRNAGSEGTKVKVKETELIVGDSQALATAKEMIDLREDQIERYNDFLKEQRSMRNK